jgi:anti-sigma28 factor (negative regulator of flagellin synthesis)
VNIVFPAEQITLEKESTDSEKEEETTLKRPISLKINEISLKPQLTKLIKDGIVEIRDIKVEFLGAAIVNGTLEMKKTSEGNSYTINLPEIKNIPLLKIPNLNKLFSKLGQLVQFDLMGTLSGSLSLTLPDKMKEMEGKFSLEIQKAKAFNVVVPFKGFGPVELPDPELGTISIVVNITKRSEVDKFAKGVAGQTKIWHFENAKIDGDDVSLVIDNKSYFEWREPFNSSMLDLNLTISFSDDYIKKAIALKTYLASPDAMKFKKGKWLVIRCQGVLSQIRCQPGRVSTPQEPQKVSPQVSKKQPSRDKGLNKMKSPTGEVETVNTNNNSFNVVEPRDETSDFPKNKLLDKTERNVKDVTPDKIIKQDAAKLKKTPGPIMRQVEFEQSPTPTENETVEKVEGQDENVTVPDEGEEGNKEEKVDKDVKEGTEQEQPESE